MSIYTDLKKPIYSLAPMEDITDSVFRRVVSSVGRPDLMYTEFVNVEGLNSKGKEKVVHRLDFDNSERPLVVQLWGLTPTLFEESSRLVSGMGFDGIDINMGCSVKKVSGRGAGSGLISNPDLALEIIESVKRGSGDLPVSVKTRLGWGVVDVDGWIGLLLKQNLDVLTVHMRTARGEGAIHADWSYMSRILELRDKYSPNTLVFGNGDVNSMSEAEEMVKGYGVDGVMIGRSAIFNPWVFSGREDVSQEERFELFKYHLNLFKDSWDGVKDFNSLKKFFRAYIKGFDGANDMRQRFMMCKGVDECIELLEEIVS